MNNYLIELIKRGKELDNITKEHNLANTNELYLIREILKQYGLNEQSEVGVEKLVSTKIAEIVKDILQEGFDIAMGGSVFLTKEENVEEQERLYNEAVKKYTEIISNFSE